MQTYLQSSSDKQEAKLNTQLGKKKKKSKNLHDGVLSSEWYSVCSVIW